MSQQQQQQERQQQRQAQERAREDSRQEAPSRQRTGEESAAQVPGRAEKHKSDMALEGARATAGKDGAHSLRVQTVSVQLPDADSCRFVVMTAAGNAVEAVMEQRTYRQCYQGISSLQTGIVPVAPIGTKGKLTVRDLTTGEMFEQPWIWRKGVRRESGFWALLKRWFT
jgi:hypothetical protein